MKQIQISISDFLKFKNVCIFSLKLTLCLLKQFFVVERMVAFYTKILAQDKIPTSLMVKVAELRIYYAQQEKSPRLKYM